MNAQVKTLISVPSIEFGDSGDVGTVPLAVLKEWSLQLLSHPRVCSLVRVLRTAA